MTRLRSLPRASLPLPLALCLAACGPSLFGGGDPDGGTDPDGGGGGSGPRVILMIGDGMGRGQLAAAEARAGALFMPSLPSRGEIVTGSLSGITDSAAAATTMATGLRTYNAYIGSGPHGEPVETLVELAHRRDLRAGIVSTAYLSHATPASFTAHRLSRHDVDGIAADQAEIRADVMLGGGAAHLGPHTDAFRGAGFDVVTTAEELRAADPDSGRVLGLFADEHMDYVVDRGADSTQPTLAEMSLRALDLLESSGDGYFLMIEGARIDMASHGNDFERAVTETIAFDQAVREVSAWAEQHDDVLLIVTADHECGGLEPFPEVSWRWGEHTNARVDVFASGPGSELFYQQVLDHRWVHAALVAALTGESVAEPERVLVPDGHLADLRHRVAEQTRDTDFGAGQNQLDALWIDADARGLAIGIEGLFQWDENAVAVLIDSDFGEGTGHASLAGSLSDADGTLDAVLSSLKLTSPQVAGFGADVAIGSWGGIEVQRENLLPEAGARGLVPPLGAADDLGWHAAATNFGEGVRVRKPSEPAPGEGFEVFVPWDVLYPGRDGGVPPGTRVAVAAVLVNSDGGYTSNQVLPPFDVTVGSPARSEVRLPGVISLLVDSNQDGIGDGEATPSVVVTGN